MSTRSFQLNRNVSIYYAGDDSGILVFSPATGITLRLSIELLPVLHSMQNNDYFDEQQWNKLMSEFDQQAAELVWQNLLANKIVSEVSMDES